MTGPHDRFFRYLFNHPARTEALLRHNLPASLMAEMDWPSLRRESGTLVDGERETRKDLLFSARCLRASLEEPPRFFLIEHQSSVDPWMALRMYPVWAGANGEGGQWAVRSQYRMDAVPTELEARAHTGPALVPLGLLVLSFAGTKHLARRLPHWSDLFAQVHATDGPQTLYRVVRYVHHLGDEEAVASVRRVLHSIMESTRAEAFMRTMAEVLRERGHQEGWSKGRATGLAEGEAKGEAKGLAKGEAKGLAKGEAKGLAKGEAKGLAKGEAKGLAKAVLRLLAARGLRVDDASRARIQGCMDVALLERWLERALIATQVSEVLDGPT